MSLWGQISGQRLQPLSSVLMSVTYAFPIMAVGAILLFFFKKEQVQNIGEVLFGFGGLFLRSRVYEWWDEAAS